MLVASLTMQHCDFPSNQTLVPKHYPKCTCHWHNGSWALICSVLDYSYCSVFDDICVLQNGRRTGRALFSPHVNSGVQALRIGGIHGSNHLNNGCYILWSTVGSDLSNGSHLYFTVLICCKIREIVGCLHSHAREKHCRIWSCGQSKVHQVIFFKYCF